LLYKWFEELKKLKGQFTHWCEERQKKIAKEEPKVNPSLNYKWLTKLKNPMSISSKTKKIGKILSFYAEPAKNPGHKNIRMVAKTRHLGNLIWWQPRTFVFPLDNVYTKSEKKEIVIPHNYYWNRHPDGTFVLVSPHGEKTFTWNTENVDKDLKEIAIDGFAAQMASYSSVKPTWGHEERMMEKESEGKALGFGRFLKKKKPEKED